MVVVFLVTLIRQIVGVTVPLVARRRKLYPYGIGKRAADNPVNFAKAIITQRCCRTSGPFVAGIFGDNSQRAANRVATVQSSLRAF